MKSLLRDLQALEVMIDEGMIEADIQRIGAEQELCFIDKHWCPAPVVTKVLKEANDSRFTYEHARFNAEINVDPLLFEGKALSRLEDHLMHLLAKLEKAAATANARIILTGILPTIKKSDLHISNLTPQPRYHALSAIMNERRGRPYEFRIEGTDLLTTKHDSTMMEGCNTSFQIHLQVSSQDFGKLYNWAQLISGPVLASATNSPILLGKRLWRETRIALFQQSLDTRRLSHLVTEKMPRVWFGNDWVQDSVLELFHEDVVRYPVLLHAEGQEDAFEKLASGQVPTLRAFQVHNGTNYRWNRACYGITNGIPHLRIENRYLPSGPTVKDEVANAAFWLGLMKGIPDDYPSVPILPFHQVKNNFIKAARMGLGAQFSWINKKRVTAKVLILDELLPMAKVGLIKAGVDLAEADEYLNIIKERVETEQTGSQWTLDSFNTLKTKGTNYEALVDTTSAIVDNQKQNIPVHKWKSAKLHAAGGWKSRFKKVNQLMSRDLFTVKEDDILDLATRVMDWQHIRHVPVENKKGEFTGLITSRTILQTFGLGVTSQPKVIKDVMIKHPATVEANATTEKALTMMIEKKVSCLPVLDKGILVGIITESDFMKMLDRIIKEPHE
ncbi:MAG: CBS domain-containing protein [Reichenbachiella sp.]|uniref:CBS domain-containing protein n=1 Tax=Reichenbachiella sp. TaxID=2184521 RepID=UPI00326376F7